MSRLITQFHLARSRSIGLRAALSEAFWLAMIVIALVLLMLPREVWGQSVGITVPKGTKVEVFVSGDTTKAQCQCVKPDTAKKVVAKPVARKPLAPKPDLVALAKKRLEQREDSIRIALRVLALEDSLRRASDKSDSAKVADAFKLPASARHEFLMVPMPRDMRLTIDMRHSFKDTLVVKHIGLVNPVVPTTTVGGYDWRPVWITGIVLGVAATAYCISENCFGKNTDKYRSGPSTSGPVNAPNGLRFGLSGFIRP